MNRQQLLDIMTIRAEMRADRIMEQFNVDWNEPDPMDEMKNSNVEEPVVEEENG